MIRVGVVDDLAQTRAILSEWVRSLPGCQVAWEAASVPEAQRELLRQRPDAILLDEVLPGVSGLDWLPELGKLGLPVILITGSVEEPESTTRRAGYPRLVKPSWESLRGDSGRLRVALETLLGPDAFDT